MYFYFHGLISMHTKKSIVIECNGVGYEVIVSHPEDFPIGENMFVFTCMITSENSSTLYGFKTLEEKGLFDSLLKVSGIGPKIALSILSSSSISRLKKAIEESDSKYLMSLPGIGKKNASQIILDLKGYLEKESEISLLDDDKNHLVYEGLKSLGFKDKDIYRVLNEIEDRNTLSAEEIISECLKRLSR